MRFVLEVIADRGRGPRDPAGAVSAAVRGGVDWVQVRDKTGPAADSYHLMHRLIATGLPAKWFINDRVDVALVTGAHGVHLARRSLPVSAARCIVPPGMLVGASVHALDEARAAVAEGADYLVFGHVFDTRSHPGVPARGLHALAEVVEAVPVPVLAIGGITPSNVADVLETRCAGVAVIGAILESQDPQRAAARLRAAMDRVAVRPRVSLPFVTGRGEYHAARGQR